MISESPYTVMEDRPMSRAKVTSLTAASASTATSASGSTTATEILPNDDTGIYWFYTSNSEHQFQVPCWAYSRKNKVGNQKRKLIAKASNIRKLRWG
ncbi:hypothetical protein CFP56_032490 [Quercus suber]|uniref:Uncharacterized protein n=1 Tax=Quercus suber TaxID=58331 RepID=A0AAW0JGR0_QUESU